MVNGVGGDGFFSQLDNNGTFQQALVFPDDGNALALDPQGTVYIGGSFGHTAQFPTGDTLTVHGSNGYLDLALLKFSPNAPPIDPTPRIDTYFAAPEAVIAGDPLSLERISRTL